MIKYITILALFAFLQSAAKAETVICPNSIETAQEIKSTHNGFTPFNFKNTTHKNIGAGLYAGHPKYLGELAPVHGKNIYEFTGKSSVNIPYYVLCRYFGTSLSLKKELETEPATCEVTESENTYIMDCKGLEE